MNNKKSTKELFFSYIIPLLAFITLTAPINLIAEPVNKTIQISNSEIELLILEGIDAIYDSANDKYRTSVLNAIYSHNSYTTGSPDQHLISFSSFFLSQLSKLGNEIPLNQRKLFWDYACIILINKMMFFMDSFKPRCNLDYFKPMIEDYIEKECRVHSIFG